MRMMTGETVDKNKANLAAWLHGCGGTATFREFMQAALYDPTAGYYSTTVRDVGATGDFSTSATIHPVLARAVASWILQTGQRLFPDGGTWNLIEVGAGTGTMARDVIRALPWWQRWHVRLHLVEESPALRRLQQNRLGGWRAKWHDSLGAALAECDGRALVYSNELPDAFPCNVVEYRNGIWQEVGLRLAGGLIKECLLDLPEHLSDPGQFSIWQALSEPAEGQRCELHDSYRHWLAGWSSDLVAGAVLTIDYGALAGELYERRPQGSVRAYFQHQVLEGLAVYQRFGRQDLTADVNFTDLQIWGDLAGWQTDFYMTQAEFIRSRTPTAATTVEEMLRIRQLTEESGAGGAFKVLCQVKGI